MVIQLDEAIRRGLSEEVRFKLDLKAQVGVEVRVVFQAEETSCAKALKWECVRQV